MEINFQDSRRSPAHIIPLAARSRFAKSTADAKLVKYLAKHWCLSRAAAGTICAGERLLS